MGIENLWVVLQLKFFINNFLILKVYLVFRKASRNCFVKMETKIIFTTYFVFILFSLERMWYMCVYRHFSLCTQTTYEILRK